MKKIVIITILVFGSLFLLSTKAKATSYTCFPTCSQIDGKMTNLWAESPNFLTELTYYFEFASSKNFSYIEIGIFDGDSGKTNTGVIDLVNGNWDSTTTQLRYTLYADPKGDGSGTYIVGEWLGNDANPVDGIYWNSSSATMPNNDWWTVVVQNSSYAESPSGNYFYTLKVEHTDPSVPSGSDFKLRTNRDFFIRYKFFSIISALEITNDVYILYPEFSGDTMNPGPSTYDGNWDLYLESFTSRSEFKLWDGDGDFGSNFAGIYDTDDLNTANLSLQTWSVGSGASLEGAKGLGSPADDFSHPLWRREPSFIYDITTPGETVYANLDPSGNNEWELFNVLNGTFDGSVMDWGSNDLLPAGIYSFDINGLDLHNTVYLKLYAKLIGVDQSGNPQVPVKPYTVSTNVWFDENRNGVRDESESGIPSVLINLMDSNGEVIATTQTDGNGDFSFEVEALSQDPYTDEVIYDGIYVAQVDASNHEKGGALYGYGLTSGQEMISYTVTTDNVLGENIGYGVLPVTGDSVGILYMVGVLIVGVFAVKIRNYKFETESKALGYKLI